MLRVLNRDLRASFDEELFDHVAGYDPERELVDIRLRARAAHEVKIRALGLTVRFAAGEEMRTEISVKFTRAGLETSLAPPGSAGPVLDRPRQATSRCPSGARLGPSEALARLHAGLVRRQGPMISRLLRPRKLLCGVWRSTWRSVSRCAILAVGSACRLMRPRAKQRTRRWRRTCSAACSGAPTAAASCAWPGTSRADRGDRLALRRRARALRAARRRRARRRPVRLHAGHDVRRDARVDSPHRVSQPPPRHAVGWIAGLLSFYNSTFYRHYHGWHHRFTQIRGRDPELDDPTTPPICSIYLLELIGWYWWTGKLQTHLAIARGRVAGYGFLNEEGRGRTSCAPCGSSSWSTPPRSLCRFALWRPLFVTYWLLPVALKPT